jgi:hypothetical protein
LTDTEAVLIGEDALVGESPAKTPAPTDDRPTSHDDRPTFTDDTPAPTDNAEAPSDDTPTPIDDAEAPTDDKLAPTGGAPPPTDGAEAPTIEAPPATDAPTQPVRRVDRRRAKRTRRNVLIGVILLVVAATVAGVFTVGRYRDHGRQPGLQAGASQRGSAGGYQGETQDGPTNAPLGDGADAVSTAATATSEQQTVAVTISVSLASAGAPPTSELSGSGDVDFGAGTGALTFTASGKAGDVQLVFDGSMVYVDVGASLEKVFAGKTWLAAGTGQLGPASPIVGYQVEEFEQRVGNPAEVLQPLVATGVVTTSQGASTFEGVPVHHYVVVSSQNPADGTDAPATADPGASSSSPAPEDVYVSSHHLLKAIVVTDDVIAFGKVFTQTTQTVFSHYGTAVTAATPPLADLASMQQLQFVLSLAASASHAAH